MRRLVLGALAFFGLFLLLATIAAGFAWRATNGFGDGELHDGRRGFFPFAGLFLVAALVLLVIGLRSLRRTTGPVADVMEGVGRVADGDLDARVTPRGRRDDRRLARSFNRMAERLQSDETRRRELLADLAHELRTPLAVIRGHTEAMLDGVYPSDPEHLRTVLEEAGLISRLLDDLRTLSTAEAGALTLRPEAVTPASLIEGGVAAVEVQAQAKHVSVRVAAPADLPLVLVDPLRIGEVLTNLLQNAIRHSPDRGTVTVTASATETQDGRAIVMTVADDGPGVPEDLVPHMFDRFVKGSDSDGSGLGLAIAKSLVEAHGGSISARVPPGGGTELSVVLPVES